MKQQGFGSTRTLSLFLASMILVGCSGKPIVNSGDDSVFRNKSLDYAKSKVIDRIQVPQNLSGAQIQSDLLTIPTSQALAKSNGIKAAPRPDFVFAQAGNESAHLTGSSNLKQISVAGSLSKVQGQVAQFWSNQAVAIEAVSNVKTVETQWFSLSDNLNSDNFISRWIRSLTKADDDIAYGRVKIELKEIPNNRVQLSLYFLQFTQLEITQNKVIDWQGSGRTLANESEITFELLRYLSHTSKVAQIMDEKSQKYQIPLIGKDQFDQPLVQLNMSYKDAFPKVLNAMSAFDVGSYDEELKTIYFTHTSHVRSVEKTGSKSSGMLGWFKDLHSGNGNADKSRGIKLDTSLLGGDAIEEPIKDLTIYSANSQLATTTSLADKKGFKVWMGGKVVYVFEDEDQGNVSETGEYTYVGQFQLSFQTTLTSVYLQVLDNQGQPAAKVYAQEILSKLQSEINK